MQSVLHLWLIPNYSYVLQPNCWFSVDFGNLTHPPPPSLLPIRSHGLGQGFPAALLISKFVPHQTPAALLCSLLFAPASPGRQNSCPTLLCLLAWLACLRLLREAKVLPCFSGPCWMVEWSVEKGFSLRHFQAVPSSAFFRTLLPCAWGVGGVTTECVNILFISCFQFGAQLRPFLLDCWKADYWILEYVYLRNIQLWDGVTGIAVKLTSNGSSFSKYLIYWIPFMFLLLWGILKWLLPKFCFWRGLNTPMSRRRTYADNYTEKPESTACRCTQLPQEVRSLCCGSCVGVSQEDLVYAGGGTWVSRDMKKSALLFVLQGMEVKTHLDHRESYL